MRQVPGGRMSTTLCDTAPIGARFGVRGPFGDCTLRDGEQDRPLLLVGVGTGLAPMLGLARDAYARGWRAPVTLIQAGLNDPCLRATLIPISGDNPPIHSCLLFIDLKSMVCAPSR